MVDSTVDSNDTVEFVRQHMINHARSKLAATTRYYPLGGKTPAMGTGRLRL